MEKSKSFIFTIPKYDSSDLATIGPIMAKCTAAETSKDIELWLYIADGDSAQIAILAVVSRGEYS